MERVKKSSEKTHVEWTVRKIVEMIEDGRIDFNIDIQRDYVWKDNDQKSALIQSLILEDFVPPLYFNAVDNTWEGIDGQQRAITVAKFVKGEFELSDVQEITIVNEENEEEDIDVNGLKFQELPTCIQNAILEFTFTICFKIDADQEEMARNFYNLNNGCKMSAAMLNRLKAKSKEQIIRISKHPMFAEALSEKALKGRVNDDLVGRMHAMLHAENPEMSQSWSRKYTKTAEITPEDEEQLNKVLTRIQKVHELIEDEKVKKKIYGKTHMVSIVPTIWESIQDGLSDEQTMNWFVGFFTVKGRATTISDIYNKAAGGSGTGKKDAVRRRLDELAKNYSSYVSKIRKEL